ncbi:MAG: hypothetical protein WD004_05770 [Actinomycetota bacterium]
MSKREPDLTLHLDRVEDLFVASHVDLAAGKLDVDAGMDQLMSELRAHRGPTKVRVTIALPRDAADQVSRDRVLELIRTYCTSTIHRNENEIKATLREGARSMFPATLLLAGCLALAFVLAASKALGEAGTRLVGAGLGIVGWVGMWQPLQQLLYDWWPWHRDNKLYAILMAMDLTVQTER